MREVLDAAVVRRWCRLAADALGRTRAEIDALNVFPVPDADTGTNLHLTVLAAAQALERLPDAADAAATWTALTQGALLGARGNSGIILSQMFRGLAEVLGASETPPDGTALGKALDHAAALARAAVAHPVDGTILSVLEAASAAADPPAAADPRRTLAAAALAAAGRARAALGRTKEQLAVLAANGVVDAGGAGLCVVLDALAAAAGEEFPGQFTVPGKAGSGAHSPVASPGEAPSGPSPPGPAPSGGAYEVMYLIEAPDENVPALRTELDGLGDSLVVVGGDGLWNVHVHADDAGAAIEAGLAAGRPHRIRVTYLPAGPAPHAAAPGARAWAEARARTDAGAGSRQAERTGRTGRTGRGVVAVTAGPGLAALFEHAGARTVIRESGDDAPVPSADLLLARIVETGDEVAVLPNDPEVIAVAEAAAALAAERGVRVSVVPTEASVQGLAALAVHDPERRFDDDVLGMTHAAGATRHARLEMTPVGVRGVLAGEVTASGTEAVAVARLLLDRMLSDGGELVTLVIGAAAAPGRGGAGGLGGLGAALEEHLRTAHPGVEVVGYDGGQDHYPLLIGVE